MYKALEKLAPAFQLYVLVSRPPDPLLVVLIKWLTTKTTSFWTRSSARLEAHFSISFPKDGMLFVSLLCLIVFQSLVLFVLWACIDVVYSRGDIDLIRELRKTLISLGQETEHGVEPKRIRVSFTFFYGMTDSSSSSRCTCLHLRSSATKGTSCKMAPLRVPLDSSITSPKSPSQVTFESFLPSNGRKTSQNTLQLSFYCQVCHKCNSWSRRNGWGRVQAKTECRGGAISPIRHSDHCMLCEPLLTL